jgi:phosphatidylinositol glycan class K
MKSTPGVRSDLFPRPLTKTLLTDFFGGVSQAEVVTEEAIESHVKSTPTDTFSRPKTGDKKPKIVNPSAVKIETPKDPSSGGDFVPSATIRAWAGASLLGLFVAWIVISAGQPS